MIGRAACGGALLLAIGACASMPSVPAASGATPAVATPSVTAPAVATPPPARAAPSIVDPDARFWYADTHPLGRAPADSLVNQNGSARILDQRFYDSYWAAHAPTLATWSADARLRLNPNFVAALMAKESGFDPQATSFVPANGVAQITHIADLDLRIITRDAAAWRWMYDEVRRWPRSPVVHDSLARKARTDSLLRAGTLGARSEYLFDARLSTRAALFWLRILAHVWTEDSWPGQHGTLARTRLAGGAALSESDLLALVTVSYNQGHPYVADLVQRHGRAWTSHLNEESSDYLERIAKYTAIFQRAATGR